VWRDGQLAQLQVQAAPDTGLAAIKTGEDYTKVFFQSPSGKLQCVLTSQGGGWRLSSELPDTDPLPGASVYAIEVNTIPHVFFAHRDNSIHELIMGSDGWSGKFVRILLVLLQSIFPSQWKV
jgi:hypothetical protein